MNNNNSGYKSFTLIELMILVAFIGIFLYLAIPAYKDSQQQHEVKQKVMSFLEEMNPELNKKIVEIQEEVARIDNKIQQLHDLKTEFPNQVLIDKTLSQWQALRKQLSQVPNDIYQQVETAYVAYRIDEIQGRKKFGVLSKELFKEANAALANAETTKSTIEEQLSE